MTRQNKYPETSTFHYYNANPKNRKSDDCAIRAVCTVLDQSWETTVREMTEVGIKHGYVVNDRKTIDKYLESKGWHKMSQPRKDDNTKYTGEEFCMIQQNGIKGKKSRVRDIRISDKIFASIGGNHVVAIVDGKVNDIWDSTDGCIGNYYIK